MRQKQYHVVMVIVIVFGASPTIPTVAGMIGILAPSAGVNSLEGLLRIQASGIRLRVYRSGCPCKS